MMKSYLALLLCYPLLINAAQLPEAYPDDARVRRVSFQENNVVTLKASTFTTTEILFSKDEIILAVEGGDTSSWMVTHHDHLPNMLFVKPTQLNSNTNLTVVTTKHHYYFHATSNKALKTNSVTPIYTVKFNYPEEERAKAERVRKEAFKKEAQSKKEKTPKVFNRNYRFSGNTQIRPAHVYDDGTFTYFELQQNQPAPAIFAVDDRQGKEAMVNTRRQGSLLIVQRLAPQFTLRHGGLVASVFNSNEIARIKQSRG